MKSKFKQRALALTLALACALAPAAAASQAMGTELKRETSEIATGTTLTSETIWSDTYSDFRKEWFFTYTPNTQVTPTVSYGENVSKLETLSTMAKRLESQGKRVVSGINGDYFVFATGNPIGIVITDGVIRVCTPYFYGIGFLPDGTAFIKKHDITISASFLGENNAVNGGINKVRTVEGGYFIFTEDFYSTTRNTSEGVDVILRPVTDNLGETVTSSQGYQVTTSDKLKVGGRVHYVVEQVLETSSATAIPSGCVILSINKQADATLVERLKKLTVGDTVDIDVCAPDARWSEATTALGGLYKMVTNGVVESGLETGQRARSAVGVKADGSVIFYTMDGNQSGHSVGATMTQVAQRMVELGCVDVLSMDGGGSTTTGVTYPDSSSMQVINSPSDGSQRSVSTALFLTTTQKATGELGALQVSPNGGMILAGSSVQMKSTGLDTNYYSMSYGGQPEYSVVSGDGTVTTGGLFTAGTTDGSVVQVQAADGNATGSAYLTTWNKADSIKVINESTGQEVTSIQARQDWVVDLSASATYKGLTMYTSDAAFTWSVSGGVGTIDQNGAFTANGTGGTGTITVSAGGKAASIPVTVVGKVTEVASFESTVSLSAGSGMTVSLEDDLNYVKYGLKSARLDYDTAGSGTASAAASMTLGSGDAYLCLWVYGDGSGNALTAKLADASGVQSTVALTTLDFTGWKWVTAAIPSGAATIESVQVVYSGGAKTAGTVYLDQITTGNTTTQDTTAPAITAARNGTQLSATIKDNVDTAINKENISLTLDGVARDFAWDASTGTLTATLPEADSQTHHIAIIASDASGNRARGSADLPAVSSKAQIFQDVSSHWGRMYIEYLYDIQVANGTQTSKGIYYYPDANISRAEFFTMLARWMELDSSAYSGVNLPFADAGSIPDWALGSFKALYSLGVVQGTQSGGKLLCNPQSNLSRAEAMTVLGRIQARGFPEVSLSSFTDAAQVPSWAASYVASLVGQGIITGSNNKINATSPITRAESAKVLYSMR
ncbi:MAG: phosphodiester glycosidase family protein [Oscillospiraceae bacterium]|nr:phosphodiester glycosidase family protein [Oscillospiraceae bacterium]